MGAFGDRVPFLDVEVYRNSSGVWHTCLYFKSSDVHAYLCPDSNHPSSIIDSIPFGVALRVARACSEFHEFCRVRRLFEYVFFPRRGYDWRVVRKAFNKAAAATRASMLVKKVKKAFSDNEVPFIFQFHKDTDLQCVLASASQAFQASTLVQPPPFKIPQKVVYKIAPNIRLRLMRSSMTRRRRSVPGCSWCAQSDCPLHGFLVESEGVDSYSTGKFHMARAQLTCDSRNVIYVVSCNLCGVQGVGECQFPKTRLVSYIDALARDESNAPNKSCAIHRHFMDAEHGPHHMHFHIVDAIPPGLIVKPSLVPALRKRLECRWIHRLDAKLNVKRYLHNSFTGDLAARIEASQ